MASVRLDFVKPETTGLTTLRIYEGPTVNGPFAIIETVAAIGAYPNYITEYTTTAAANPNDWFAIEWLDSNGVSSGVSSAIQGNTTTLVGKLKDRMLLRDSSLDEAIATQEAEGAIAEYFGVVDPYSVSAIAVAPNILTGLTLLALARAYLFRTVTQSGSVQKFTAGLVSLDQGSTSSSTQRGLGDLEAMIKMANGMLGRNYSVVALLEEIEVADGSVKQIVAADLTRSIIEVL